ncbi:MAG TPA: carboxypeptidase-like regulatory domain-containing protein, partial [Candidatus Thermoplasmatota archaeon]|nr:carboxypeptidase-like regulatory domain-containing protein [Candidatus Thermoplasmatota archaeon]
MATRPAIWYDGDHQSAITGPDGTYRFETYPGPRQVTAHAKGYGQSTLTVQAIENQTVTADLRLEKVPAADAVLVVRVLDARTGAPLRGAGVSLQNTAWSHYAWASTEADGRARLTTLPGWSHVNVHVHGEPVAVDGVESDAISRSPIGQAQYYAYVKALRLASGEQALEVRLEPKPAPTVVLTGYVVDPDAKSGVPNAQVSVWNQDTGDWGSATTDATGSYKLLVRPGHYTMNAWAERHLPGATTFVIAEGEAAKRVDVEAPAGEQRWAPCIDGCPEPRPMPAYAEDKAAENDGGATTATSAPTLGGAGAGMRATSDVAATDQGGRGAAYQGSGGGLPPYRAEDAPADGQGAGSTPTANVPGPGIAAAVVALGLLALATRRRE